jgi:hypothetical protein
MAQIVEHLPSKLETRGLYPNSVKRIYPRKKIKVAAVQYSLTFKRLKSSMLKLESKSK